MKELGTCLSAGVGLMIMCNTCGQAVTVRGNFSASWFEPACGWPSCPPARHRRSSRSRSGSNSSFAPQQLRLVKFIDGELAGRREPMVDCTPANADALIYKYGIKVPADGTEVDFWAGGHLRPADPRGECCHPHAQASEGGRSRLAPCPPGSPVEHDFRLCKVVAPTPPRYGGARALSRPTNPPMRQVVPMGAETLPETDGGSPPRGRIDRPLLRELLNRPRLALSATTTV